RICCCASAGHRSCPLGQFGDAPPVSEVSLLLPAICVSPAAKKRFCRTSKSGRALCLEGAQWHGYRASWEEDAHWECFWGPTTFQGSWPNDMDMSIDHYRTPSLRSLSMR